jgi:hypothetical protein
MLTRKTQMLLLAAVLLLQVVQIDSNVGASTVTVAPLHMREGDRASSKQWTFDTDENEEYSASSVQQAQCGSSQLHKEGKEVFHKLFKVQMNTCITLVTSILNAFRYSACMEACAGCHGSFSNTLQRARVAAAGHATCFQWLLQSAKCDRQCCCNSRRLHLQAGRRCCY